MSGKLIISVSNETFSSFLHQIVVFLNQFDLLDAGIARFQLGKSRPIISHTERHFLARRISRAILCHENSSFLCPTNQFEFFVVVVFFYIFFNEKHETSGP